MKRLPFVRLLHLWMIFVLLLTVAEGSVAINEVMASNAGSIFDEEGDTPDWIELYNGGADPVALGGYALSDSRLAPFRWVFPDVSIAPGGFLVIWASGKDRALAGAPLHTNFSIAAGGESILLTAPNGARVDEIGPRAIPTGISLGRQPDGTGVWFYFTRPTRGSANVTTAFAGLTPSPVFSAAPGFYAQGFDLQIASAGPDAVIYYTLDGSAPDPNNLSGRTYRFMDTYPGGSLINRQYRTFSYSDAIRVASRVGEANGISEIPTAFDGFPRPGAGWEPPSEEVFKATVVRAMAVSPNHVPSPVSTATYFIDEEKSSRYTFPVISLTTTEDALFDYERGIYVPGRTFNDWRRNNPTAPLNGASPANYLREGPLWELPAHIEFYEPGGELAFAQNVGIRIHGGWSRINRQKALRVFARNAYDEESSIRHPVFPGHQRQGGGGVLDEFKRLILHISGQDNGLTMFRDAMAQSLIAHTGIDTLAYRPAVVFLNGEYWGFHNIRERYDHHYIATNYEVEPEDVVILQGNVEVVAGEPGDDQAYRQMVQFIANAASQGTIDQPQVFAQIEELMDVDNFIHHYAAQIYYANIDWPAGNLRWWRHKGEPNTGRHGQDGKWRWMMYDTDHGFGLFVTDGWGGWRIQADHNTVSHATTSSATPVLWSNPPWATQLFRSLLVSRTFRHRFLNTYADHLNSSFKPERVIARIDEMQAHVAPEYPEYAARWNHPSAFWYGGNTWEEKVDVMRTFAQARQGYIRMYLNDHFGLGGLAPLTLDVAGNDGGRIRINSMVVDEKTPGAGQAAYPWSGFYFRTVPVTLEAKPLPGYRLVRWTDGVGGDLGDSPVIEVLVDAVKTVIAEFEVDPDATFVPAPHALGEGAYSFNFWAPESPAGTYPPHLRFEQTGEEDPTLATVMDSYWELPYNLTSRSRMVGLGGDGFAFINTENVQAMEGAGFLGSAILALNTMGEEAIRVSWTGGTVLPNSRVFGVRLQARVGDEGDFVDLLDASGGPVEYLRNGTPGHSRMIGPVTLPETFSNRPCVQLRWKYYYTGRQLDPASGQRSMLRVSDILVTSGPEESFGAWREQWFDGGALGDPEVSGPGADPGGQGVPNLLRYALAMDQEGSVGEALPRIAITDGRLEMNFHRDPAKSDIAYIVEASPDLQGWAEVLYDSRADPRENDLGNKMRISDSKTIGETGAGKRFIRLRVLLLD